MPIPHIETFERTFIRDDVYESLRSWIVLGQLEPGEKLKDKELAAQLGVSRTPVREALRKLEDEGLVESAANRWTRVTPVTLKEAERIYPIIRSLEMLALDLAFPHLSELHLARMQRANNDLREASGRGDPHAAVSADAALHQVLIDAADNPELAGVLEQLKTRYKRLELAYFSDAASLAASYQEHQALISALEEGDKEAAKNALADNWRASAERLQVSGGQRWRFVTFCC